MTEDRFEIISALLDGEAVEPDRLEQVLAEPAARALLVDFVRLRRDVRQDESSAPAVGLEQAATPRRAGPWTWVWSARVPLPVAVVLVLVVAVGSLALGVRPVATTGDPPTAERTVRFEPGVDWYETR